jgi:hypothetical protein
VNRKQEAGIEEWEKRKQGVGSRERGAGKKNAGSRDCCKKSKN